MGMDLNFIHRKTPYWVAASDPSMKQTPPSTEVQLYTMSIMYQYAT